MKSALFNWKSVAIFVSIIVAVLFLNRLGESTVRPQKPQAIQPAETTQTSTPQVVSVVGRGSAYFVLVKMSRPSAQGMLLSQADSAVAWGTRDFMKIDWPNGLGCIAFKTINEFNEVSLGYLVERDGKYVRDDRANPQEFYLALSARYKPH